jgi:hypothetical protein
MVDELKTWAKLGCFSRKKRKDARNVIDARWVIKYKWDEKVQSVGQTGNSSDTAQRTIRSRLTIRGFKDMDKWNIDKYAGTCSRYAQKILVSECARRGWHLCAADVSKAFLQGVTYKELAEITHTEVREVNFTIPAYCTEMLRQVPGFETFDPKEEVLHL